MQTMPILPILAVVLASIFGLCVLPITLAFKADRRKREMEHIERMTALEMGRPIPGEQLKVRWPVPYQIAVAIGAGVPIVAFTCSWLTSMQTGYQDGIWLASMIVGLGGVISGSVLAFQVFARSGATSGLESAEMPHNGKPFITDDAYDVVSSRG